MTNRTELEQLIHDLADVKREYTRLAFDEEDRMQLGQPATSEQIAALEKHIGNPLPPSYRAFLELHNGWEHFDGGLNLLSVEDQDSAWVRDWLTMLATAFMAVSERNPFDSGAIPVLLGEGEHTFLIMDLNTIRPDGEMDFVKYDYAELDQRYRDFTSFLRDDLDAERQLLEKEKKGTPDDDEGEED